MPVERWRIGQHTKFVLIEHWLSANDLKHDLTSAFFGEAPMNGRATRVDGDNMHFSHCLLDLIDRLALTKNI